MEFRRDVAAVARQGDQSQAQVTRAVGICELYLARWLPIADREDDNDTMLAKTADEVEVRELRRRNKQLEQEVEIVRRATGPRHCSPVFFFAT